MWANTQRNGRPAECRWRPLFNAAVWLTPASRVLCSNQGRYSRKVVNGGRSYERSYAELTTSVVIHERNRTYDR